MIAYLHTQDTPLFYLPSDLLVKVDQLDDPSTANVDNLLTKALQDVVSAAKASSLWYGVTPCSAHAMYRLADCYDLEELKEMGLGFITRSLTAENVSGLLSFSQLNSLPTTIENTLHRSRTNSSVPSHSITKQFKNLFSNSSSRTGCVIFLSPSSRYSGEQS